MLTHKNQTHLTVEPGKQELFIVREFDAPRELVFEAFTHADLYVQWLGPRRLTMSLEIFEPVSGGRWRYIQTDTDGSAYGFHGVFHEVAAPHRIIQTFEFEGLPESGHVVLETLNLEALPGGSTRLTAQSVFQSVADRDGMVQAGMEAGVVDGYQRLDGLLEKMVKPSMAPTTSIDAYIASYPKDIQEILEKIRGIIRKAAPGAAEDMKYGLPTFILGGNLVHFGAFKKHIGFYPTPSGIEQFREALSAYQGAKGSIQFPLDKPIPYDLIREIVHFRVQESQEKAQARRKKK